MCGTAGGGHHQDQTIDEFRVGKGQLQRDEPSHRDADQRRPIDTKCAGESVDVIRDVADRVRVDCRIAVADIPIVECERPEALPQCRELLVPALTLGADPAQQQDRALRIGGGDLFVRQPATRDLDEVRRSELHHVL